MSCSSKDAAKRMEKNQSYLGEEVFLRSLIFLHVF